MINNMLVVVKQHVLSMNETERIEMGDSNSKLISHDC